MAFFAIWHCSTRFFKQSVQLKREMVFFDYKTNQVYRFSIRWNADKTELRTVKQPRNWEWRGGEKRKREISGQRNDSIIVTVVLICSAINDNRLRSTVAGQSQWISRFNRHAGFRGILEPRRVETQSRRFPLLALKFGQIESDPWRSLAKLHPPPPPPSSRQPVADVAINNDLPFRFLPLFPLFSFLSLFYFYTLSFFLLTIREYSGKLRKET